MDFARALKEVEKKLSAIQSSPRPEKWQAKNYVGAGVSELIFLDIKIPQVRALFKKGFSFSQRPAEEQWEIWHYIWQHSRLFEAMVMLSYWVSSRPLTELLAHDQKALEWIDRLDNWAHSDELSSHYVRMLEHDHKKYLPLLKSWSQSENPWYKRQSLVSLLYYSRGRKKVLPFKTIIRFVDNLLADEHYYVQKGVGWTLRECYNVYPKQTFAYLLKKAVLISPTAFYAATEKLSLSQKKQIMRARKLRQKKR